MHGTLGTWITATFYPAARVVAVPLQSISPSTLWGSILFILGFITLSWLWAQDRRIWWAVGNLWTGEMYDLILLIIPIVSILPVLAVLYGGGQILGWPVFILAGVVTVWNLLSDNWNPFHLGYVIAIGWLGLAAGAVSLFFSSPFTLLTSGTWRLGSLLCLVPGFAAWAIEATRQSELPIDDTLGDEQHTEDSTGEDSDVPESTESHQEEVDQSPDKDEVAPTDGTTDPHLSETNTQDSSIVENDEPGLELEFPWEKPPDTSFSDIGGYDSVKSRLGEKVVAPLVTDNESYDRFDVKPARGILFYGPPGTGKTLFARALARELGRPFVELDQASLTSKWINESPNLIGTLFEEAQALGGVVFIDEAEVLLGGRKSDLSRHQEDHKVTSTFLTALSRDDQQFVVVMTTNKRDQIDEAILRPGRIDVQLEIGEPGPEDRFETFTQKLEGLPVDIPEWRRKALAVEWDDAVGADIEEAVEQAKRNAAEENANTLTLSHFDLRAAKKVQSIPEARRAEYASSV